MKLDSGYEFILVDSSTGRKLVEYGFKVEHSEEDAHAPWGRCWVPSTTDQTFAIHFRDHVRTYDTQGCLYVDGKLIKIWTTGTNEEKVDIRAVDVSSEATARLKFVPRRVADSAENASTIKSSKSSSRHNDIGTIAIRLRRGKRSFDADQNSKGPPALFSEASPMSPDLAAGLEHEVGVGTPTPTLPFQQLHHTFTADKHYGRSMWFRFQYRSEEVLQSMGYEMRSKNYNGTFEPVTPFVNRPHMSTFTAPAFAETPTRLNGSEAPVRPLLSRHGSDETRSSGSPAASTPSNSAVPPPPFAFNVPTGSDVSLASGSQTFANRQSQPVVTPVSTPSSFAPPQIDGRAESAEPKVAKVTFGGQVAHYLQRVELEVQSLEEQAAKYNEEKEMLMKWKAGVEMAVQEASGDEDPDCAMESDSEDEDQKMVASIKEQLRKLEDKLRALHKQADIARSNLEMGRRYDTTFLRAGEEDSWLSPKKRKLKNGRAARVG